MKIFIPQYLHKPNKVLFMDMDELCVLLFAIILGMALKSIFLLIAGLICFYFYRKGKATFPRGFYKHIPHILGFKQFKYFPSIFIREFKE